MMPRVQKKTSLRVAKGKSRMKSETNTRNPNGSKKTLSGESKNYTNLTDLKGVYVELLMLMKPVGGCATGEE